MFIKSAFSLNSKLVITIATLLASSSISVEKEANLAPRREPFPIKINLSRGRSGRSPIVIAFSILIWLPKAPAIITCSISRQVMPTLLTNV